ncbi:MAG: acyl carrier protein [Anaerolineales bacterium]
MNQTFKLIKKTLVEVFSYEEDDVTSYAKFREDLDMDSQGIVELTKTIDKHGVGINFEDANEINTIWELVRYIETDISFGKPTTFDKVKESFVDFFTGNDDKTTGNYRSCILRLGLAFSVLAGSILGGYYGFAYFGWVGAVIGVVLGYLLGMYIFSALFVV